MDLRAEVAALRERLRKELEAVQQALNHGDWIKTELCLLEAEATKDEIKRLEAQHQDQVRLQAIHMLGDSLSFSLGPGERYCGLSNQVRADKSAVYCRQLTPLELEALSLLAKCPLQQTAAGKLYFWYEEVISDPLSDTRSQVVSSESPGSLVVKKLSAAYPELLDLQERYALLQERLEGLEKELS